MRGSDEFEGTREEMARAIRRLDALEYVILGTAFLLALVGGGLIALVLSAGTGLPFRLTWAILSLGLLAVPGAIVLGREHFRARKREEERRGRMAEDGPQGPHETTN